MLVAAIDVNANLILLAGTSVFFTIIGFIYGRRQRGSLKKKLSDLEREMLDCHAEILQLQKEKIDLLKSLSEPSIPVISITASKEEKNIEKLPDVVSRKKLLGQQPAIKQQSGG